MVDHEILMLETFANVTAKIVVQMLSLGIQNCPSFLINCNLMQIKSITNTSAITSIYHWCKVIVYTNDKLIRENLTIRKGLLV